MTTYTKTDLTCYSCMHSNRRTATQCTLCSLTYTYPNMKRYVGCGCTYSELLYAIFTTLFPCFCYPYISLHLTFFRLVLVQVATTLMVSCLILTLWMLGQTLVPLIHTQASFKGFPYNCRQLAYGSFQLTHVTWQPWRSSRASNGSQKEYKKFLSAHNCATGVSFSMQVSVHDDNHGSVLRIFVGLSKALITSAPRGVSDTLGSAHDSDHNGIVRIFVGHCSSLIHQGWQQPWWSGMHFTPSWLWGCG